MFITFKICMHCAICHVFLRWNLLLWHMSIHCPTVAHIYIPHKQKMQKMLVQIQQSVKPVVPESDCSKTRWGRSQYEMHFPHSSTHPPRIDWSLLHCTNDKRFLHSNVFYSQISRVSFGKTNPPEVPHTGSVDHLHKAAALPTWGPSQTMAGQGDPPQGSAQQSNGSVTTRPFVGWLEWCHWLIAPLQSTWQESGSSAHSLVSTKWCHKKMTAHVHWCSSAYRHAPNLHRIRLEWVIPFLQRIPVQPRALQRSLNVPKKYAGWMKKSRCLLHWINTTWCRVCR